MRTSLMIAAALLATAVSAGAEEAPQIAMAPGAFSATAPRQLVHQTALVYPKSIVPQDREASVLLTYTIEPDGHVDQLRIVKSATAPFDNEAVKALAGRISSPAPTATQGATALVEFHAAP
ncbi:MAG TPA: TonB family protein [Stellaceae bacterium]|nr:TonB family protein [Stellaceae bacterium]